MKPYPIAQSSVSPFKLALTLIGVILAAGSISVWAAKAPVSADELKIQSSHIFTGEVLEVTTTERKSKNETSFGSHRDRIYSIQIRIISVAKDSDGSLKVGKEVIAEAWIPIRRRPAIPGLQGHETIPAKGDRVTVFVKRKDGAIFHPILPNGIEIHKSPAKKDQKS